MAIEDLKDGDHILVAEACSHHPIGDDIGRVKIPRWLRQYAGGKLSFTTVQGHDFPDDLTGYDLVVHCGACMWNRREMLSRMVRCRAAGGAHLQLRPDDSVFTGDIRAGPRPVRTTRLRHIAASRPPAG